LLRRRADDVAMLSRVAQDGGPELLIDEDSGGIPWHPLGQRKLESVIDHLLAAGDGGRLRCGQRWRKPEQLLLEACAMIEGQKVKRAIVAFSHHRPPARGAAARR